MAAGVSNVTARIAELIQRSDVDELTRQIDELCDGEQWGVLYQLREQCRRMRVKAA